MLDASITMICQSIVFYVLLFLFFLHYLSMLYVLLNSIYSFNLQPFGTQELI